MKRKYILQIIQDLMMLFIVGSLMGFHLWGEKTHEILGILFLAISIEHLILNFYWMKRIFQRDYDLFQILKILTNVALFSLFLASIISGLMLSQSVLPDLFIHSSSDFVRKVHMTSVHWLQILIAIHLGVHWKMLADFLSRLWQISERSLIRKLSSFVTFALCVYGVYVFISRKMMAYLVLQVDFAFFNFEEPAVVYYFDYIAVMVLVAYTTRVLIWLLIFVHSKLFEANEVN
ncbi:DUF4405 domain-containing protein [Cohaesibacter celericrescens]|uniref:Flavinylation-associated cytochrome domain-containing protein n=1 Tax=Cohaesibacter celericrescens TaxID=2067669 RepID=A0A2N5XPZ1_9HYPH|nr:DUF4405 domain-containing protein [Cohaesibacter celericrescens]PLW76596.1 hypothetical protein C0081_13895 [Cohaesibacter celericrescens]